MFQSVDSVISRLGGERYICDRDVATVVYLACAMAKPILVEGPASVGKTELGKALASSLDLELIRLQCYEGLDETKALYEWEYAKQLLWLNPEIRSNWGVGDSEMPRYARYCDIVEECRNMNQLYKIIDRVAT